MQMWYAKNSLEDNPSKDTENAEREGNKPPNNKHNPDN